MIDIINTVSAALVERDAEVRAITLAVLAQEHVLMVGPPGTAKSMAARSVAAAIAGARYCERLMSPTTPPEALFGPISISALREDRYEHVVAGTVADAELVFLDEFFRGSDAIKDTLLHLLGPERQALIGTSQVRVPLRCCIAASNAWPEAGPQDAVFDRFLIRRAVRPVSPQGRERLLYDDLPVVQPVVSLAEIDAAAERARSLPISDEARGALSRILDEIAGAGIRVSDRRARASVKIARAAAVLDGAAEVAAHHLEDLGMVLWTDPGTADRCAEIVTQVANPVGARLNALLAEVDQAVQAAADAAGRMKAIKQLEESEREARRLTENGNGRAKAAAAYIRQARVKLQAEALGLDPRKVEAMLGAAA